MRRWKHASNVSKPSSAARSNYGSCEAHRFIAVSPLPGRERGRGWGSRPTRRTHPPSSTYPRMLDLRRAFVAGLLPKENIVVPVGVERRIEIDEVYGLVGDVPLQNVQIVPEIERIHADTYQRIRSRILHGSAARLLLSKNYRRAIIFLLTLRTALHDELKFFAWGRSASRPSDAQSPYRVVRRTSSLRLQSEEL
jgi:hypothetical protein